ncbi:MAG: serine hydrolase [Gemmatimonadaceae bacterium]
MDSVHARLRTLPTTALVAVVGGRILTDYGDPAAVSYLASVRKSVLSMLVGRHVAAGTLRLDRTLAEIGIDDIGGLSAEERQATVRDLLSARSGIYHAASNPGDDLASAPPRGSQPHGTYQLYNNWDFNALGTIFERETGQGIYDALAADLATPIGMEDFDRRAQRKTGDSTRSRHLAYHMHLSTRDMARLGYLMLRGGRWNGEQLVPEAWVRASTSAVTPVSELHPERRRDGPFGYGFLWWVWDGAANAGPYRGGFTAMGLGGQQITVLPALDLVVAHKTRPGQERRVSDDEYLQILDLLVRARCPAAGC